MTQKAFLILCMAFLGAGYECAATANARIVAKPAENPIKQELERVQQDMNAVMQDLNEAQETLAEVEELMNELQQRYTRLSQQQQELEKMLQEQPPFTPIQLDKDGPVGDDRARNLAPQLAAEE